jgi:hypothetical protein
MVSVVVRRIVQGWIGTLLSQVQEGSGIVNARNPNPLRPVVSIEELQGTQYGAYYRLTLSCGHAVDRYKSDLHNKTPKRARCLRCPSKIQKLLQ